jgi:hypothetical protein
MTYVAPVFELSVIGIFDEGIPHQERIILRPTQAVDLSNFALLVGYQAAEGIVPFNDHFRWLGPGVIGPPSWLVIYTDSGTDVETTHQETGEPVFIKHWGRSHTFFNDGPFTLAVGVMRIGGFTSWLAKKPIPPGYRRIG